MKHVRYTSKWMPGLLVTLLAAGTGIAQDFEDGSMPPPENIPQSPQPPPPPPPPPVSGEDMGDAPPADMDYDGGGGDFSAPDDSGGGESFSAPAGKGPKRKTDAVTTTQPAPAANIPRGEELVSIDFPEPTNIQDIVKAVSQWSGKNFIWTRKVTGTKVAIISPKMVTKEEAYQAFLSALHVAGFTTVETGKITKIIPLNVAPRSNLKTFYGSSWAPMTDEMITQIIPLTFIPARDLSRQIKSNLRLTRNIWAFEATNSVIITDTGHNVRKILELIRLLDVKSNQPQFTIESIKNTDAADMQKKIQEIFNTRSGASPYLQKAIVDQRSNSLLLVGPPKGLDDVVRVIRRLDKPLSDTGSQAQIHVRPLEFADAEKLAQTLQNLTQAAGRGSSTFNRLPVPSSPTTFGGPTSRAGTVATVVADLGDVKITADKATNSLIIRGSKAAYNELNNIIKALDKRRDQVYIEVDVLDIDINNQFNMQMSALGGARLNNGKIIMPFGWNPGNAAPFIIDRSGISSDKASTLIQGIPGDAILGVLGSKAIDIGGIKLSPGAFLFALKTDGNSNVLQTPSVLVADNEDATFNATEREYIQNTETDQNTKISRNVWKDYDATLEVKIKPQVSESDYINLDITVKADRFGTKNAENAPANKNSRLTTTKVTLKNRQTVVLNGLVRDVETTTMSKVPLLGDLPVLGWLFRNTSKQKSKTNLAIFITPYVVRDAEDLAEIYEKKVKERDEFLEAFFGKDFREKSVFARMPTLERGKAQPDVPPATPGEPAPQDTPADPNQDPENGNGTLPSKDPDPVVVPGAEGGGGGGFGGGEPMYDTGGDGGFSDGGASPIPPPPPPPPSDLEPPADNGDYQ